MVLEGLMSILEQHIKTDGGAALSVSLLSDTPDEEGFAKLESIRDLLDVGETLEVCC